jgi:hypothetical protein
MKLSIALILSLALAQAADQPDSIIRQRQVRRNDTGEPQKIKMLPRAEESKKKSKDTAVETESKKKSKDTESEGKKKSKDSTAGAGSKRKDQKNTSVKPEGKKKNKDSATNDGSQRKEKNKDLETKFKEIEEIQTKVDAVTVDLGDMFGVGGGSQTTDEAKDKKREKKSGDESSSVQEEKIVAQEINTGAGTGAGTSFGVGGGRTKHVGHGIRKRGPGHRLGGGAQKLQGYASGKAGKIEEFSEYIQGNASGKAGKIEEFVAYRKQRGGGSRGGRNKTKTRGSGMLRNIGGDVKDSKKMTTGNVIGTRGSFYDGKARKL